MEYTLFIKKLTQLTQEKLPGWDAQKQLSVPLRKNFTYDEVVKFNAKTASVLILLQYKNGKICFPVTLRNSYEGVHSDQVSLPGGKYEDTDKNVIFTAKRETAEEIGIPEDKIKIISPLSQLYIPPSNFLVTPFLGYLDEPLLYKKDEVEVKEIIDISIHDLLNENHITEKSMDLYGMEFNVPIFLFNNLIIWGATAMILSEFRVIVKNILENQYEARK